MSLTAALAVSLPGAASDTNPASGRWMHPCRRRLGFLTIHIHQVGEATVIPDRAEQGLLQIIAAGAGCLADGMNIRRREVHQKCFDFVALTVTEAGSKV